MKRLWSLIPVTGPARLPGGFSSFRSVATWTPLAATFNRKPQKKLTFAFNKERKGLFGHPQLSQAQGFYLLKKDVENETERLLAEATSPNRRRNVVEIFDELSDCLCRVADLAECVRVLHSDSAFADAAEEANSDINGLVEELNTNRPLFNALKDAVAKGDVKPMDAVDLHVAKLFLVDFEQCGIHLDEDKRKKVVELNARILSAGTTFMKRCHEPRYVTSSLIPELVQPFFQRDHDSIVVTNLMSDCTNELVREAAFKVYLAPDKYQEEPLRELLHLRYHLARLIGFPSYSTRANRGSVFEKPEIISKFLQSLSSRLRPLAHEECSQMLDRKRYEDKEATTVNAWDTAYLISATRQSGAEVDASDLAPYFPLGACVEGLNQLIESIFDVHFVIEEPSTEDLWSSDVYKLSVRTKDEEILGFIYCDFYERPDKPHQDCHFTVRCGRELPDGSYQLPVVVLSLNFTPPLMNTPCLLQFWQIDNLFHEMGHAMHSMLGRTKYQHVTGTRCSTDFAEVPSTLMEQFAADSRFHALKRRLELHRAFFDESMKEKAIKWLLEQGFHESVLEKLCNSRKICAATEYQLQTFYAILDQEYHGTKAPVNTTEVYAKLHEKHLAAPYVPNTAWQLRFGHLFGYGARYYSYLLARSLASDIWQKLFKDDPYSKLGGLRLRDRMLRHGGGRPPLELVSDVLEHQPSIEELVDALINMTKK